MLCSFAAAALFGDDLPSTAIRAHVLMIIMSTLAFECAGRVVATRAGIRARRRVGSAVTQIQCRPPSTTVGTFRLVYAGSPTGIAIFIAFFRVTFATAVGLGRAADPAMAAGSGLATGLVLGGHPDMLV
jgi:hypothetical protein